VLGYIVLTSVRADIPMQLAIDFGGILLMVAVAALLTWSKASGRRSDAAVAASTTSAVRRRHLDGLRQHATAWAVGVRSTLMRPKRRLVRMQDWFAPARGERQWPAIARRSPMGSA
jgi:hypothetical protein